MSSPSFRGPLSYRRVLGNGVLALQREAQRLARARGDHRVMRSRHSKGPTKDSSNLTTRKQIGQPARVTPFNGMGYFPGCGANPENVTFAPMNETLIPFHQQAQDEGEYVLEERTRDAQGRRPVERPDGPSENAD